VVRCRREVAENDDGSGTGASRWRLSGMDLATNGVRTRSLGRRPLTLAGFFRF
jgi:hypothetical protein